ncbi:MAG: DUF2332 domain-containing protein [Erythrobacter sp.]
MTLSPAARASGAQPGGETRIARQLALEAAKALAFGKPRAALLMQALARALPRCAMARLLEAWPGDLAADAMTFRLCAGLHALARSGRAPGLAPLYDEGVPLPEPAALEAAVRAALAAHAAALEAWIAHPTQTNEVARVAGLAAVLMELNARAPMPCEVLELGCSAGLNLNLAHYACRVGARTALAAHSAVELAPVWRGRLPAVRRVEVVQALGVDLKPLDAACPEDCDRLAVYIWPGERARSQRLDAALALARQHPPQIAEGHAGDWLIDMLAEPQPSGVRRVVFHSMTMQYVDPLERAMIEEALEAAGACAGPERPLMRVGMEWRTDRQVVELRVTTWDGRGAASATVLAGHCHPYGEWIEWHGLG